MSSFCTGSIFWSCLAVPLFCCSPHVPLFRDIPFVPSVFRCFISVPVFRQCSGVLSMFQCSISVPVFRWCSVAVPCSVVPCSGVPGFIVCRMKQNRGDYVCKYLLVLIFQFCFQKNHYFIEKSNPLEKNDIAEEELDCIDFDYTGNLEDSFRLVFINEECVNLIVVNDGGELTRNVNQRK